MNTTRVDWVYRYRVSFALGIRTLWLLNVTHSKNFMAVSLFFNPCFINSFMSIFKPTFVQQFVVSDNILTEIK